MRTLTQIVRDLMDADPDGAWLRRTFEQLEEVHWGALRNPGVITAGPEPRDVPLVDGPMHLGCVIETDTLLVGFEDARAAPLPAGTADDPKRHHVSRCIEALRRITKARAQDLGLDTDPLFGVIVVAGSDFEEPHRTTILEGLPHIEREQAEDLYASYWGRITPARLEATAPAAHREP